MLDLVERFLMFLDAKKDVEIECVHLEIGLLCPEVLLEERQKK